MIFLLCVLVDLKDTIKLLVRVTFLLKTFDSPGDNINNLNQKIENLLDIGETISNLNDEIINLFNKYIDKGSSSEFVGSNAVSYEEYQQEIQTETTTYNNFISNTVIETINADISKKRLQISLCNTQISYLQGLINSLPIPNFNNYS